MRHLLQPFDLLTPPYVRLLGFYHFEIFQQNQRNPEVALEHLMKSASEYRRAAETYPSDDVQSACKF